MRSFLRGVEAAIAVMILMIGLQFLYTIKFTFHPHESRALSNVASSALRAYRPAIQDYVLEGDLSSVDSLLEWVIPPEFSHTITVKYFRPIEVMFGSSGIRPVVSTIDFSSSVDEKSVEILDSEGHALTSQTTWNWYRVPFLIINNETIRNYTAIAQFNLPWQDTNNDGTKEPVDQSTLTLYLNNSLYNYQLRNITSVNQTDILDMSFSVELQENGTIYGYMYYKVIR